MHVSAKAGAGTSVSVAYESQAGADFRGKRVGGPESIGESHLCTPSTACPSPRTPRATCQVLESAASCNQDIHQEADIHPWWDVADSDYFALPSDDVVEDQIMLALGSLDARGTEPLPAPRPFASLGLPSWAFEQRSSSPSSRCCSPCSTRSSSPALSGFESPVSWTHAAQRGRSPVAFCSLTRGDKQEKPAAVSWADLADEEDLELQIVIPEAQPRPTARGKIRWVDLAESASDEEMGWTF